MHGVLIKGDVLVSAKGVLIEGFHCTCIMYMYMYMCVHVPWVPEAYQIM